MVRETLKPIPGSIGYVVSAIGMCSKTDQMQQVYQELVAGLTGDMADTDGKPEDQAAWTILGLVAERFPRRNEQWKNDWQTVPGMNFERAAALKRESKERVRKMREESALAAGAVMSSDDD